MFGDFEQAASEMLQEFGTTVSLMVTGEGVFNPATGGYTDSELPYAVQAAFLDYPTFRSGQQTAEGTLIQAGDKQCFMKPLVAIPEFLASRDTILLPSGIMYRIANIKSINPTMGTPIVYEIHLKI